MIQFILKVSGLSSLGLNTPTAAKQGFRAIYFPTWNQHILPTHYFKCGIAGTTSLLEKLLPLNSSSADFTKPTTPVLHQAVMRTSQTAIRARIPQKKEPKFPFDGEILTFFQYKYFYTGSIFCSTAVVPHCSPSVSAPSHPRNGPPSATTCCRKTSTMLWR